MRETRNHFTCSVTHAHDLLPVIHRWRWRDCRANCNCDASGTREPGAVTQHLPRSIERDGHDFTLRRDGGFERAEMKRAHAGLRRESSLRKNEDGFAAPHGFLDLLRLMQSRARIFPAKREMAELAKKRAKKRHGHHFGFGDEMVVRAKRGH